MLNTSRNILSLVRLTVNEVEIYKSFKALKGKTIVVKCNVRVLKVERD